MSLFVEPLPRGFFSLLALTLLVLSALLVLLFVASRRPVVSEISPQTFVADTRITIEGDRFGSLPHTIEVSGQRIGSNRIVSWRENQIVVEMPAGIPSGMLYVRTARGTSRGVVLTNGSELPEPASTRQPNSPVVQSIETLGAYVGGLVRIRGVRLGKRRGSREICFTAAHSTAATVLPEPDETGYPSWADDELIVRIPHGAGSGPVTLSVPGREMQIGSIELDASGAGLSYGNRVEIALRHEISYGEVELQSNTAESSPGARSITFWLPAVPELPEQRELRTIRAAAAPTLRVPPWMRVFRFRGLTSGDEATVSEVVVMYRRTVALEDTRIVARQWSDADTAFLSRYTRATDRIPAGNPEIVAAAGSRAAGAPLQVARRLFDWTRERLEYAPYLEDVSVEAGLRSGYGDSYSYAMLLTAALRAAGIPARPVSGYVVTSARDAYVHYWCELMLLGVGWVPMDPFFGDGNFPGSFPQPGDPAAYYFGGLDAQRVTISLGEREHGPLDEGARLWTPAEPPSLQRAYVELGPRLARAEIDWDGVTILGLYR